MKKAIVSVLIMALAVFSVFAGGSKESQAVAADSGVTQVTFVFADGDAGAKQSINEIVNRFNAAHDDMRVVIQPGNGGNYSEFVRTRDSVGEFPDIVEMRGEAAMYIRAGKLAPLPAELTDLFLSPMVIDGNIYTVALAGENTTGIIYNKTYFDEHGLTEPKTYAEFIELCQTIQDLGDMAPLVVGGGDLWHMGFLFNMCWDDMVISQDPDFIAHCYDEADVRGEDKAETDKEPATGLYLDVDNAKTDLENALKEGSGATDQDKADAQKIYDDAVADLNEALAGLEEMQAYLEELNRLLKAYDDAYAAYYSEMKALGSGELVNAYYQAMTAYEEAYDKWNENDVQIQALNNLLSNQELINVQRLIKEQEEEIKKAEDAIEALSALKDSFDPEKNPDISKSEIYAQFMIEYITEKIAQLEEQIAIQEQIVASAKAALEEALAGESTPAE